MMDRFYENIANFTHGMALMFFLVISVELYRHRNRNRLLKSLFLLMVFLAFIHLKDVVYLVDGPWHSDHYTYVCHTFDMWCIPIFSVFLFEVISPGWVNTFRAILIFAPLVIFTLLNILFPSEQMFRTGIIYSNIQALVTMVFIFISTSRYNKYIRNTYSYLENLDVSWIRKLVVLLFFVLFMWSVVIWHNSLLGDSFYYLFSVGICYYIYYYSTKHSIVDVPDVLNPFAREDEETMGGEDEEAAVKENRQLAERLQLAMESEHLYLNPRLTISEVSLALRTNRTYLYEYLKETLGTNFYDYVNSYRIKMASSLLVEVENLKLEEIAEQCGFNSISTFRRSFIKAMGMTPIQYKEKYRNS